MNYTGVLVNIQQRNKELVYLNITSDICSIQMVKFTFYHLLQQSLKILQETCPLVHIIHTITLYVGQI